MSEERFTKLVTNIEKEERYPPLVVRPLPDADGEYQVLDGSHRLQALATLGHSEAVCFPWPCDDATALVLLATLNRLEGEDVPARRAELLRGLTGLIGPEEMALLLPENGAQITATLDLLQMDSEALLAELVAAAEHQAARAPRHISFAVAPEDEAVVEEAITRAATGFEGPNRRGAALAVVCRHYLEDRDD
jgi:ParB-like chromosome segregation protein Spo0J